MSKRRLQIHERYRYGRKGVLAPGDRFRVTGGPVYVTDDGTSIPMYERGLLIFHRYCEQGAAKWIEAHRADGGGFVVPWVGKPCRSKTVPNMRRRPYRVTGKVRSTPTARRRKMRCDPSVN